MNIQEMIKNMDPNTLKSTVDQMSAFISPAQKEQLLKVIDSAQKGELDAQLNHVKISDLKHQLSQNPALMKQVSQNPGVSEKLNEIFNN